MWWRRLAHKYGILLSPSELFEGKPFGKKAHGKIVEVDHTTGLTKRRVR